MIVNPTDGQKYLVTSNMGRHVLKKYLTAYKNGGSSEDFEDELSDIDEEIPLLSPEDIELRINTLRQRIPETDADSELLYNTYITDIDNHIKQLMTVIMRILAEVSDRDEEIEYLKQEISKLYRIIAIARAAG